MLTGHLPELLIVLTLALVVFGPKRIPEIGSSLGQGIQAFKKGVSQLDFEVPPAQTPVPVESRPLAAVFEPRPSTPIVPDHRTG
jgi:sec-independent protein translocase protein TatA